MDNKVTCVQMHTHDRLFHEEAFGAGQRIYHFVDSSDLCHEYSCKQKLTDL